MSNSTKIEEIRVGSKCLPVVDEEARATAEANATRLKDMEQAHYATMADNQEFKANAIKELSKLTTELKAIVSNLLYKQFRTNSVATKADLPDTDNGAFWYVENEGTWYFYYLDGDKWVSFANDLVFKTQLETYIQTELLEAGIIKGDEIKTNKITSPDNNVGITFKDEDGNYNVYFNSYGRLMRLLTVNGLYDVLHPSLHVDELRAETFYSGTTITANGLIKSWDTVEGVEVTGEYINATNEVKAPEVKASKFMDKDTGDYFFFNPDDCNFPSFSWTDPDCPEDGPYIEVIAWRSDIDNIYNTMYDEKKFKVINKQNFKNVTIDGVVKHACEMLVPQPAGNVRKMVYFEIYNHYNNYYTTFITHDITKHTFLYPADDGTYQPARLIQYIKTGGRYVTIEFLDSSYTYEFSTNDYIKFSTCQINYEE